MNKKDTIKEMKNLSKERSNIMGKFSEDIDKNTEKFIQVLMEFEEKPVKHSKGKDVIIYTTPTCHWCTKLRNYLKNNKVEYTEKGIADNEKYKDEMVDKSGQLGVPVTDFKGEIIVGFDEDALDKAINSSP